MMIRRSNIVWVLALCLSAMSVQAEAYQAAASAGSRSASAASRQKQKKSSAGKGRQSAETAKSAAVSAAPAEEPAAGTDSAAETSAEAVPSGAEAESAAADTGAVSAPSAEAAASGAEAETPAASEQIPAAPKKSERPWAEGIDPTEQKIALALFREGNGLLKDSVFAQAAAKYREALSHWDHPAIHYNLVLALLNLDRPTEVLEHLGKAMAYGPDPIDPEKYEQARNYKVMIESQLARLVITCEQEGAVVAMDGQELFIGPGRYEGFVRPGPHAIVAKKEGFVNNEVSPSLAPGQRGEYNMVLMTATELTEYRRLWPLWRPWAVVGAGVVVAGVGAALHIKGRQNISDYDAAVNQANANRGTGEGLDGSSYEIDGTSGGLILSGDLDSKRESGERYQKIAMAMYGIGGAAIVAGSILVYMNRLKPYTPEVSGASASGSGSGGDAAAQSPKAATPEVAVLPILSPDTAGVMATVRF